MITTTIRSSISVKPFLVLIFKSPESVDDGETRCRQHCKDGRFRCIATPVMAMSLPDFHKRISHYSGTTCVGVFKSFSTTNGRILQPSLQCAPRFLRTQKVYS